MSKSKLVPGSKRASTKPVAKSAFGFQTKKVREYFSAKSYFKVGLAYAAIAFLVFGQLLIPNSTTKTAQADAADPILASSTGNYSFNPDGSIVFTISGGWQWTTHTTDCNLDKRAVGFAMDWNDPSQPGNVVGTIGTTTVDVGTAAANSLNPLDNLVHATPPATDSTSTSIWRGGCGTYAQHGVDSHGHPISYNSGTWGPISHTYPAGTTVIAPCVVTYDVHLLSDGGAPKNASEIKAGGSSHSGDNSVEKNGNTPLGNGCFSTTIQTLIVQKHVVNHNGGVKGSGDFQMHVTGNSPDLTSFAGSEAGTQVHLGTGSYSVDEDADPGYFKVLGDGCTGNISAGQTKICVITNNDIQPKVTVNKIVINDSGTGHSSASDFSLFVGNTQLTNGVQVGMNTGSFSVHESGPSGYTATFSGDCDSTGQITLGLGDVKTCTITNDDNLPPPPQQGRLTVTKVMVNDNNGQKQVGDFQYFVDSTPVTSGQSVTLPVGSYVVSEGSHDNYTSTIGGACDAQGNVSLADGEDKICTITNDDIAPKLKLVKNLVGGGSASDWSLTATGTSGFTDLGNSNTFHDVSAGVTYTLSESGPSGYSAGDWSCNVDGGQSGNTITLSLGESVTCSITNTKLGKIIVDKVTDPSGSPQVFNFNLNQGDNSTPFALTDAQDPAEFSDLQPGTYTVTENNIPNNWALQNGHPVCVYDNESVGNAITNGESIVLDAGDVVTCTFTDIYTAPENPQADLEVLKTVGDAQKDIDVDNNTNVTFEVKIINHGPSTANNVVVADPLPTGLSWISDDGNGDYDHLTGNWIVGTLVNGASATLHITAKAAGEGGTEIVNTASTTLDIDPNPDNNSDSADVGINIQSNPIVTDPAISKTVDNVNPAPGSTIIYTLVVSNASAVAANNVVVDDPMPSAVTYVSDDAAIDADTVFDTTTKTLTWTIPTIAANGSVTLHITATVNGNASGSISNTATIKSGANEGDADKTNDSSTTGIVVGCTSNCGGGGGGGGSSPILDLAIAKSVSNANPTVGANVTYTVTVTNNGPSTAINTVVNDVIPAGETLVSSVASTGSFAGGVWNIGTLNSGASATMTLVVTVNNPGTIVNTATVTNSVSDSNLANNTASASLLAGEVAGAFTTAPTPQVKGATTLPRTGASNGILNFAGLLVLALIALGINMSFNLKTSEKKA